MGHSIKFQVNHNKLKYLTPFFYMTVSLGSLQKQPAYERSQVLEAHSLRKYFFKKLYIVLQLTDTVDVERSYLHAKGLK